MSYGIKTVIYPVTDMAQAKATFQTLLGVEPYADSPYYVGFKVGDMDIGLDPNGHKAGMTAYYTVDDIKQRLQSLLDAGAQIEQEIKDTGGGGLIASVKDALLSALPEHLAQSRKGAKKAPYAVNASFTRGVVEQAKAPRRCASPAG